MSQTYRKKGVLMVEKRLTSPLGYTGRLDLVCRLIDGQHYLIDYKTPAIESPTWKAQCAAYCELAKSELLGTIPTIKKLGNMALMLNKEGKAARGIVYQYRADDFAAFLSALNCKRYFVK